MPGLGLKWITVVSGLVAMCCKHTHVDPQTREERGQWRIHDLKEGGARSIACEAHAQIFSHAPHLRILEDSWLTKKAVLGLAMMRIHC